MRQCWISLGCYLLLCGLFPPASAEQANEGEAPVIVDGMPTGHRFVTGELRRYLSESKQEVTWRSAGDELTFTTTLEMEFSCYAEAVSSDELRLVWRVLDLRARHHGPGVDHRLDSARNEGLDDPLLGDLMVYHLAPLTLVVNPSSGRVRRVEGTDVLVQRLNQRHPAPNPTLPPPRAAAAEVAFDPLRIQQLFGRYLATPGHGDPSLGLGPHSEGNAQLRWEGNRFHLSLPEDSPAPTLRLHSDPTPVELTVAALRGEGQTRISSEGILQRVQGELAMTIQGHALTQGVSQEHAMRWQMVLLARTIPAKDDNTP